MRIRQDEQLGTRRQRRATHILGFSMVEMVIVMSIALMVAGFAVFSAQGAMKDARINGAYDTAFMQLRTARQRAIEERKRYIVTFGMPAPTGALTPLGAPTAQSIQLYRWDAGNPSPAPVQISTIDMPSDVQFQTLSGFPTGATTVPDGFGNGITALDFDQGVGAAAVPNLVVFMPDGSAIDRLGNSNSGVLYIARNSELTSARAVTVFGTSGRIRGWRLLSPGGVATWKQQ